MADSNIAVTPGVGAPVDTRTNAAGEHRQVMILGDGQAQSDLIAVFRPDSVLRAAVDPTTVLVDPFDSLDTVNTWTLGGNNVPTQAAGRLTVSAAITASMQSTIRSQPVFVYQSPSFLEGVFVAALEAGVVTGNKRCWGFGTLPATSTVAIPLANGICFEIQDTDGSLVGAAYSNSVRAQTVALTRPADGALHRYAIYYKTTRVYFEIDNIAVGSIAYPDPQVMNLPLAMVSVNAAAGQPGTAAVLAFSTVSVADYGRNGASIVDGTYPWREAQVGKNAGLSIRACSIATQTLAVTAATPVTGTGLDVSEAGACTFIVKNTVAATAFTGVPVIVFEQSDDNVSWAPLAVVGATGAAVSSPVIATGAANAEQMFDAALEGVNWVRVRVVTAQATNGMTVVTQPGGGFFSPSVAVIQQPLVKGTQGAAGVTIQQLHDAGRNQTNWFMTLPVITTAAEVMQSMTGYHTGAAVGATVSPTVVTAGKTYRITHVEITYIAATVIGGAQVKLRANLSGAGVVGSPLVKTWYVGNNATFVAGEVQTCAFDYPEGLEFAAGTGIAIGVIGGGANPTTATITGFVMVSIEGYEY